VSVLLLPSEQSADRLWEGDWGLLTYLLRESDAHRLIVNNLCKFLLPVVVFVYKFI
jgi:hypothetical protein